MINYDSELDDLKELEGVDEELRVLLKLSGADKIKKSLLRLIELKSILSQSDQKFAIKSIYEENEDYIEEIVTLNREHVKNTLSKLKHYRGGKYVKNREGKY